MPTVSGQSCQLQNGLVSWWPADGTPRDVADGNDGILIGGVSFAPGKVSDAFHLDGLDDEVNVGNASNLRVSSGDFTVNAWVLFDDVFQAPAAAYACGPAGCDMSIVDKMAQDPNGRRFNLDGWRLIKQADNRFWFCFGGNDGNRCWDPAFTVFSTTPVFPGVWYHVAAVKTSTSFGIYVNGVLEDSRFGLPPFVDTNTTPVVIGGATTQGTEYLPYFRGLIDEVQIHNRALSSEEIQAIFTSTAPICGVAPVITGLTLPGDPQPLGGSVTLEGSFEDANALDTHHAIVDWGDGITADAVVTEVAGGGSVSATHVYASPGVYEVRLSVIDSASLSAQRAFDFVVIYDAAAGFVTGGGWIDSPAGAYAADASLTGKATFGFVSKYETGAKVPTGQTEFNFQVASFRFKSAAYEWLVVSGARAQYKGVGTVNGTGDYGFLLTATDGQIFGGGGVDKLRVKIWERASGRIVYDNVAGASDDFASSKSQAIGGGSIVIHGTR